MRVRAIAFDEHEEPETVTVEMTMDEAAVIARLTGRLSPAVVVAALDGGGGNGNRNRWADAAIEVYHCLSQSLFNRFWDDGLNDVIPEWKKPDPSSPPNPQRRQEYPAK